MRVPECIKHEIRTLSDFRVPITDEIINHLISLYPNDIAMENYMYKLIIDHLDYIDKTGRYR